LIVFTKQFIINLADSIAKSLNLPAGFHHSGNIPFQSQEPETDAAQSEFTDESSGSAATATAVMSPDFEFGLSLGLFYH
jgi:hypothetical protein